jgi:hypothetical protein
MTAIKQLSIFIILFLTVFTGFSQIQEGTVVVDVPQEIKTIINKKIAHNKSITKIDGYRIQIFSGGEYNAKRNLSRFNALYPNTPTRLDYELPDWKVRVGYYKTRQEADKAMEVIKFKFESPIVIISKIPL